MERKPRLENKVAIITGAGSRAPGIGNGRAAAILFAREGAKVLLVDRSDSAAEDTLAMIRKEGGEAEIFSADVTKDEDCRAMVERAVKRWGKLDILDNNVGIDVGRANVVTVTDEQWNDIMTVNVKSIVRTGKYAVPAMAAGGGGAIVNIASTAALRPSVITPYSVSKGAVITLTRAMAIDHAKDHIRVNCVAPGPMYTPMAFAGGMSEEVRESRKRASPMNIEGTGWDVGNAVLFLASDEARYITGVVLVVDGGMTLASPPRNYQPTK